MSYANLIVERDGPTAIVHINRPAALNALNAATIEDLIGYFEGAIADQDLRSIIVTGSGTKAFVAGADIAEMVGMDPDGAGAFSARGHQLGEMMAHAPQIVIAAVNGWALGGGCELALACDLIVAAETAVFGQPEVKLGVTPGFGGTQRLTRRIGTAMAIELLATGDNLSAADALRIGLINRIVPPSELLSTVKTIAAKIAKNGPLAVAAAKRAARATEEIGLSEGNHLEISIFASCFATEDLREGMGAFLAKRPPNFTGR